MLLHGLHPALLKAPFHLALTDGLHDLKAHFGVQPHGDEIQHDIVTAAHRLQNGGGTADDQLPCVAQPHIRTVGEAGQTHQRIEILRQGVHQHPTGEAGVELRDSHGTGGAQQLVVFKAQHLGGDENTHGVRVVQRDLAGVDAGKILQHPDHGGVIVTQHIQLQEVILHAVVFRKWVVMVSASSASAGCCTAVKSSTSMSSGTTTRPPGCWPVVRRTPTQP